MKEIGHKALYDSILGGQKKTTVIRLKTFHTQNLKSKQMCSAPGKSDEVASILWMTQIIASGSDVDIVDFIGDHKCSKVPPIIVQ